jgi:hypothetical protein
MLFKHIAYGCTVYWADRYNRFDGIIVLFSLADIASAYVDVGINASFLRALRLLRVFRIFRRLQSLQRLLTIFEGMDWEGLIWLLSLLLMTIFICAILGMQLFGLCFRPPLFMSPPRHNFDTLRSSMLTVFIVSTTESWGFVWMDAQRASGNRFAFLYFVAIIFTTSIVLLNILTALVFQAFSSAKERQSSVEKQSNTWRSNTRRIARRGSRGGLIEANPSWWPSCISLLAQAERQGFSLGLFSFQHPVRQAALGVLSWRLEASPIISFENLVFGLIIASSFSMAILSCNMLPDSPMVVKVEEIDAMIMLFFVFELMCKVIACGLLAAQERKVRPLPYLLSGWNCLDATIVFASVASSLITETSPALSVLRVFRVLRPLRLISRAEGIRRVVELFLRALPRMFDVVVLCAVLSIVYAILGVQLFAGKFGRCDNEGSQVNTRSGCLASGRTWSNPPFGDFDHIGSALLRLFEISTLEGWTELLWAGMDASQVDESPVHERSFYLSLYFVLWVLLSAFVLFDLFSARK